MTDPIVIIGGGISGYAAVKRLEKKIGLEQVLLVEPREYVEVPFASLRGLVDPSGIGRKMRRPWSEVAPVKRIAAAAQEVRGDEIFLSTGERISFAQAIIAVGARWRAANFIQGAGRERIAEREAECDREHDRLKAASSILIIGGGPVGVELAGEVAESFPEKRISLVQGEKALLPALSAGAGRKAMRVLQELGVRVILDTLLEDRNGSYYDGAGEEYAADIVYPAMGVGANPLPIDDGSALDGRGRIMVDENLRVSGRENLFAVGDANDVPEIKLGATAKIQAAKAADNVISLRRGRSRLKRYRPSKPMGFVTLGRHAGIAKLPCIRFDPLIIIKQRDLFIRWFLGKRGT